MTYKQIETSREVRLWITQVILPALGLGAALVATVPEFRTAVVDKAKAAKVAIKSKFHK